jgi:hypothetical protein
VWARVVAVAVVLELVRVEGWAQATVEVMARVEAVVRVGVEAEAVVPVVALVEAMAADLVVDYRHLVNHLLVNHHLQENRLLAGHRRRVSRRVGHLLAYHRAFRSCSLGRLESSCIFPHPWSCCSLVSWV